jgi:hypothetical protein
MVMMVMTKKPMMGKSSNDNDAPVAASDDNDDGPGYCNVVDIDCDHARDKSQDYKMLVTVMFSAIILTRLRTYCCRCC